MINIARSSERLNVVVSPNMFNANTTTAANETVEVRYKNEDTLSLDLNIKKVFAPEHGFRGNKDNGELVKDEIDSKTNFEIIPPKSSGRLHEEHDHF